MRIDLNSDCGESYGRFVVGQDEQVIPLVTSVNIACGFHGGDPHVMHRAIRLAREAGVAIGAHPGLMDLHGFGRRELPVTPAEVYDWTLYQIGALAAFTRSEKVPLHHVKPHGALYNMAARDETLAEAIASAISDFDSNLVLYALSGSALHAAGERAGLRVAAEVFADRTYLSDGTLVGRDRPDAILTDPEAAVRQVMQMVTAGTVNSVDDAMVRIQADTVCIHGDGPHALAMARAIRTALTEAGVTLKPVGAE
ncbi:MAG: LamB/YcsF family protein [Alicyclobacillus sp.]|nr:LamB/YcsF family protein [Alicyclobacillus sp.]